MINFGNTAVSSTEMKEWSPNSREEKKDNFLPFHHDLISCNRLQVSLLALFSETWENKTKLFECSANDTLMSANSGWKNVTSQEGEKRVSKTIQWAADFFPNNSDNWSNNYSFTNTMKFWLGNLQHLYPYLLETGVFGIPKLQALDFRLD